MAKVITANMARTFAGRFKQYPAFQKTMETILRRSLNGCNSVNISRDNCSDEEWEITQCWLLGLEYDIKAFANYMTVSW
jgi:hypothetical protein